MSNWKHTALAILSVVTVISMSAMQYSETLFALATKEDDAQVQVFNEIEEEEAPVIEEVIEETVAEEATFEAKTGYIIYNGGSVNVRAEASKEADITASVSFGDSFIAEGVSEDGLWYQVKLADGRVGYIMCDLVTFDYTDIKKVMLSATKYESAKVSVSGGRLNVRNMPSESGSVVIDQLADGSVVYITAIEADGWVKILFGKDYDIGYVMSDFLVLGEMVDKADIDNAKKDRLSAVLKKGTVVTNVSAVNVRNAPSESGIAVGSLKNGAECSIISQGSKWTKILYNNATAYIITSAVLDEAALADYNAKKETSTRRAASAPQQSSTASAPSVSANASMGAKIIAEGEKYIGTKYVYGGSSPSGFDCSGFVQYVMKKVGITVNRTSRDQYKNGVAVSRENLAAGDLVFFSKGGAISHVGIYAGSGKVLHSPSAGKTVTYTTLEHMCSYSTYVGARRVY